MKILFATDNFYPNVNGAANFAYELIKSLVKKGHQVSVIAPAKKFKYTVTKYNGMTIYGIRSVMIPKIIYPGGFRIPITINPTGIKAIVAEIEPELIHIQDHFMIGSIVTKAGKKLGIPMLGTNHFMPENLIHYLYPPQFAKKPLSKLAWRQFINVYKHLNLITTSTKTAVNLIKNLGLKNPIIPISCGVDLDRFNPKNSGNYLKKRYKIDNSKPVILFVGRLDKEKRLDVLMKAFSKIQSHVHAKLVITGTGKERSNLIKLAKRLGVYKDVIFTGFVPDKDLPFLYRIADIFVIASIAELQSIATMEAMASGLPILAANVMALPELVHHGKNGFLFDEGNTEMLADQIIKIIQNPSLQKTMSKNSLEIIKKHDLNKTIKKYEDIYKEVFKGRRQF